MPNEASKKNKIAIKMMVSGIKLDKKLFFMVYINTPT